MQLFFFTPPSLGGVSDAKPLFWGLKKGQKWPKTHWNFIFFIKMPNGEGGRGGPRGGLAKDQTFSGFFLCNLPLYFLCFLYLLYFLYFKEWDNGRNIIFYPHSERAFRCLCCHPCLLVRSSNQLYCFEGRSPKKAFQTYYPPNFGSNQTNFTKRQILKLDNLDLDFNFSCIVFERLLESASRGFSFFHFWSTTDCGIQLCIAFSTRF